MNAQGQKKVEIEKQNQSKGTVEKYYDHPT